MPSEEHIPTLADVNEDVPDLTTLPGGAEYEFEIVKAQIQTSANPDGNPKYKHFVRIQTRAKEGDHYPVFHNFFLPPSPSLYDGGDEDEEYKRDKNRRDRTLKNFWKCAGINAAEAKEEDPPVTLPNGKTVTPLPYWIGATFRATVSEVASDFGETGKVNEFTEFLT